MNLKPRWFFLIFKRLPQIMILKPQHSYIGFIQRWSWMFMGNLSHFSQSFQPLQTLAMKFFSCILGAIWSLLCGALVHSMWENVHVPHTANIAFTNNQYLTQVLYFSYTVQRLTFFDRIFEKSFGIDHFPKGLISYIIFKSPTFMSFAFDSTHWDCRGKKSSNNMCKSMVV